MTTQARLEFPSRSHLKAGALSGLIAGAVFLSMEMGLVALSGDSPWGPPRMIAAIVMGDSVLPPPATFDLMVLIAAMVVHLTLSVMIGLGFAFIAKRFGWVMAVVAGAVLGMALYVFNFYGMTAFFPWFAMARNTISIVSHIAFGMVLGLSYKALAK